jgi:hypothetical protein
MNTHLAEGVIKKGLDRWLDCEGLPEMTLLRLALLRELIHNLHSEKSRCLASGKREEVKSIKEWETRLEDLRESSVLSGSLMDLLEDPSHIQKRKRILPEALFQNLDREKLVRYDRKWESTIAAEAATLGWNFWFLDSWVNIALLEEWNANLNEKLWPHGLVLFVESADVKTNEVSSEGGEIELWRGCWLTVIHPEFNDPNDLSLNLNRWPAAPQEPPTPVQWKMIHPHL